jgi:SNF2 family DNA or RNA helicase
MQTLTELFPHQRDGFEKLKTSRVGALFMDMGTGKTRTAIEFAALREGRIKNVVWCCPVSLKPTIRYEIEKHTGQDAYVFDDTTRAGAVPNAFWNIVGLESIGGSDRVALALNEVITPESFVIVDESSYIKGHRAKRTKRITALAEKAKYRLILTGTPISQGVVDLYAQMAFLSPKILGYHSFYSFAANHLEYSDKYPGLIVRSLNTNWLAAKIAPYVFQVKKEECLSLPAKLHDARYFSLSQQQTEAYASAKYELFERLSLDELDSYAIFQLFTALQKIASSVKEYGEMPNPRLDALQSVLRDIQDNERVIIWFKFQDSLQAARAALPPGSVAEFHGGLTERERERQLQAWRSEKRFLLATQQTGGHGLTLNEAAYVVFYENQFKYSERAQAEDRCHRIGQARRVTYVDLWADCGIDRRIRDALAGKACAVDDFRREVEAVKRLKEKEIKKYLLNLI